MKIKIYETAVFKGQNNDTYKKTRKDHIMVITNSDELASCISSCMDVVFGEFDGLTKTYEPKLDLSFRSGPFNESYTLAIGMRGEIGTTIITYTIYGLTDEIFDVISKESLEAILGSVETKLEERKVLE